MTNKKLLALCYGALGKNWYLAARQGPPAPKIEIHLDDESLLEHFKMWQLNPSLSHSEVVSKSADFIPVSFFSEAKRGIYFLISEAVVVYIGKSNNIAQRMVSHTKNEDKEFDRVFILTIPEDKSLSEYEWPYIAKFDPKYNFQSNEPDIVAKMRQMLWVKNADMVGRIEKSITNTTPIN